MRRSGPLMPGALTTGRASDVGKKVFRITTEQVSPHSYHSSSHHILGRIIHKESVFGIYSELGQSQAEELQIRMALL